MQLLRLILLVSIVATCLFLNSAAAQGHAAVADAPPVVWARPLEGGVIRALCIAPGATQRDFEALRERLDFEYTFVGAWERNHLGSDPARPDLFPPDTRAEQVSARLDAFLEKRYDLIIIANIDAGILPEAAQQRIIEKVAAGTGLLTAHLGLTGTSLETFLATRAQAQGEDPLDRGVAKTGGWGAAGTRPMYQLGVLGEGRVVEFHYAGDFPGTHCLFPALADPLDAEPAYYDHTLSLLARAVRWAVRRDPSAWIKDIVDAGPEGPPAEEIPPDFSEEFVQSIRDSVEGQPLRPFRLVLGAPADATYTVSVQLRSPEAAQPFAYTYDTLLDKGASAYSLDLLVGPGTYYVDAWIKKKKTIVDWFTKTVQVPGWPDFTELRFSKDSVLANDTLDISLEVRTIFGRERRGIAFARAVDSHQRVVGEAYAPLTAEGGKVSLRLGLADLIAPAVNVTVYALSGDPRVFSAWELSNAVRESRLLPVRLPKQKPDLRLAAFAPLLDEYNARRSLSLLRGLGIDTVYGGDDVLAPVLAAGLGLIHIPVAAEYASPAAVDGVIREPCLTDPEYRSAQAVHLRDAVQTAKEGAESTFLIGTGNCLISSEENVCQSPTCLLGFQTYLQRLYPDLSSLNAQWNTNIGFWDEIRPASRSDVALGAPLPLWVLFRRYMEGVFTDFHRFARLQVQNVDPDAAAGMLSLEDSNPMHGYHWRDLVSTLDFLGVPDNLPVLEKLRSYQRAGSLNGIRLDEDSGGPAPEEWRHAMWSALLHQAPMIWLPAAYGTATQASTGIPLEDSGDSYEDFKGFASVAKNLKQGIAALMLAANPQAPEIAIVDSPTSRFINETLALTERQTFAAETAFVNLLRSHGFAFTFIGEEDLAAGSLEEFRVVFLPALRALSDAQAAALEAYVAAGGRLVSDIVPGGFDENAVERDQSPLQALFVTHATPEEDVAKAEEPLVPALCLRALLPGINGLDAQDWARAASAPVLSYLARSGCAPVLGPDEAFRGACYRYSYGSARLMAFLAAPGAGSQRFRARLETAKTMPYVYDVLQAMALRRANEVSLRLSAGECALISQLPYRVEAIGVLTPESILPGRRLEIRVLLKASAPNPGKHMLALDLAASGGTSDFTPGKEVPLPLYHQNLECEGGIAETFIPLAMNEKPGRYKVIVRDLLSGIVGEGQVQVLVPGASVAAPIKGG